MTAKNKVFLLQDDLAKKGLLQFADVLYRTPESPLNGKFIIVEKDPKAILELQKVGDELIGENLDGLIKTMEFESAVPTETIQSICTILFDEGKGLMLPYMKLNESNQAAEITGAALFHKDKFTGVTINTDQTKLLLALSNKRNKAMMINDTIPFKDEQLTVSYEISHSKGNLKIEKDGLNKVKVKLPFKAELDIMEFPHDRLYEKSVLENLQKGIEKKLQKMWKKPFLSSKKQTATISESAGNSLPITRNCGKNLTGKKTILKFQSNPTCRLRLCTMELLINSGLTGGITRLSVSCFL